MTYVESASRAIAPVVPKGATVILESTSPVGSTERMAEILAEARPKLVRGIVAVEPSGPPFEGAVLAKGPARAWGPTDIRITYDPPVNDPKELLREKQTKADGPDLVLCSLQTGTPRTLPNLRGIGRAPLAAFAASSLRKKPPKWS